MQSIKRVAVLALCAFGTFSIYQTAQADCTGSGDYTVCSDTYTDANGDVHAYSSDSEGNTYSVDTDTYQAPDGDTSVDSYDSEGNSYSVHSWVDSEGAHTEDSDGNSCTVTTDGTTIGC